MVDERGGQAGPADLVVIERPEPGIIRLVLNRPGRGNALSMPMISALHSALDVIAADDDCRVVVLTGAGQVFCVGADVDLIESVAPGNMQVEQLARDIAWTADLVVRMQELRQPVIAAVNGAAAGGGFALALGSDLRVCSDRARFTTAFTKIGLAGGEMGMSYTLPKIVGPTVAFDLMLTSRTIDAEEAFRIGLVSEPVPGESLTGSALSYARRIAGLSAFAISRTKGFMWRHMAATDLRTVVDAECQAQILCINTSAHADATQRLLAAHQA